MGRADEAAAWVACLPDVVTGLDVPGRNPFIACSRLAVEPRDPGRVPVPGLAPVPGRANPVRGLPLFVMGLTAWLGPLCLQRKHQCWACHKEGASHLCVPRMRRVSLAFGARYQAWPLEPRRGHPGVYLLPPVRVRSSTSPMNWSLPYYTTHFLFQVGIIYPVF